MLADVLSVLFGLNAVGMIGPFALVVLAIPLISAIWLIATARDQRGWIAYGVLTFVFLAPAIAIFLYPGIFTVTRIIFLATAVPFAFYWLVGSGIGVLFRVVRGAMLLAR